MLVRGRQGRAQWSSLEPVCHAGDGGSCLLHHCEAATQLILPSHYLRQESGPGAAIFHIYSINLW